MPLSAASSQALSRLRAFRAPPTPYHTIPLSTRAAVLVLLFPSPSGSLHVVLTLRSSQLRTFAGQVALPGGKADLRSDDGRPETAEQTARREAWEEIGLPLGERITTSATAASAPAPAPAQRESDAPSSSEEAGRGKSEWTVTRLTELPCHLARTHLVVRPVVAVLAGADDGRDPGRELVPRLQEREVDAVFSAPLEGFLSFRVPVRARSDASASASPTEEWYRGEWVEWKGGVFRQHEFQAPVYEREPDGTSTIKRYRVWGMTARILVDAARIAYGRDPEFEFMPALGDEALIARMLESGELVEKNQRRSANATPTPSPKPVVTTEKGNL